MTIKMARLLQRELRTAVLLFASTWSLPGLADDALDSSERPLKLSGFATLAATYNGNGQAGVITSFAQKEPAYQGLSANVDSDVGGQLEWKALADTSFLAQAVARAGNDMTPELRMAYVRQALGNAFAVRLGRIRGPLYFDSDVAEIGYAYMMVRPPIPLYAIANSVSALDGGDVQWRYSFGTTGLLARAYDGNSSYRQHFYYSGTDADSDIRGIRGFAISVTRPNLTVRFARTITHSSTIRSGQLEQLDEGLDQVAGGLLAASSNPLLPRSVAAAFGAQAAQIAALVNPFDSRPSYTSIGFDGDWRSLRLMGEWTELNSHAALIGKFDGYHLTTGYALGDYTPYLSVARLMRKTPLLDTGALSVTTGTALDAAAAQIRGALEVAAQQADLSSRSLSAGMRWDFRTNMALKIQYDYISTPSSIVPGSFAVQRTPFVNHTNLGTLALDIVF